MMAFVGREQSVRSPSSRTLNPTLLAWFGGKLDNGSTAGEQLSDSAVLKFSGEDSLASNKADAFLPSVPSAPVQCAAFWFPVS
jgi:hypothetical protein